MELKRRAEEKAERRFILFWAWAMGEGWAFGRFVVMRAGDW